MNTHPSAIHSRPVVFAPMPPRKYSHIASK